MTPQITPLRAWSGYSLTRGATHVERLVALAAGMGHKRLTLTDVNNLYGAPVFYRLAREAGLRPILGAELHPPAGRAVALVAGETGYENLCRIITRIFAGMENQESGTAAESRRAGTTAAPVRAVTARNLVDLSAGLHFIVQDAQFADDLLAAGMERQWLWLGIDPATQDCVHLRRLGELAERKHLRLAATGDALLGEQADRDIARLLAAIRLGVTVDSVPPAELPHAGALLRSPQRLAASLVDFPQAVAGNLALAEECSAFAFLPRGPAFPEFPCPDGLRAQAYLRRLCAEGIARRYGQSVPAGAEARLEKELRLIEQKGFSGYFLVVWDIVQYARRRGVPVAGRGSGGSSLVAYLLGITNVCPLAFDIPFERFLNERREDFPDLDIDFCWRIRDDVIEYAFRRWGHDHAAMVSTHNCFQPRSAVRETAKAFGYSDDQISRLDEGDIQAASFAPIIAMAKRIIGLPHLLSVHPGGIVLGNKPIDHYAPIQRAAKGVRITQYDKDGVEAAGLVKLDLLGNRGLSTVRCAAALVAERTGMRIDVESLPGDDPETLAALQAAETVGCCQLESPAMRHLLRAMRPSSIRDVMKALALIRPGAASIGMKGAFIRRQRGLEAPPPFDRLRARRGTQPHPDVDAILADTHGVMLYEDDVMRVAAAMMGASPAEGDRFRKAVQKCRDDEDRLRLSREFLGRCRDRGIDAEYAKSMWVQMAKFNAYSFCRAHAASYAILAYAAAWLRTHRPLEFWTAALNNNQSMYHPRVYVEQAKRAGIRFLLPDVNRSGEEFTLDAGAIRVGLNFVAGLGPAGIAAILDARKAGPFRSLSDFYTRVPLAVEEMRSLVLCGAFDSFGRRRPVLMMELNLLATLRPQRRPGQRAMFSDSPAFPNPPGDYAALRKYADERRILGISVGEHVMACWRKQFQFPISNCPLPIEERGPASSNGQLEIGNRQLDIDSRYLAGRVGRRVRIAGVLEALRTAPMQDGREVTFLTFDDEWGLFEATVFPDARATLPSPSETAYGPYVIAGRVEEQFGNMTVTANEVTFYKPEPVTAAS